MNGVYDSTSGPVLTITRSGSATAWITYKAMSGHTPKIPASGNVWNAASINGSYIVFDGFELEGNNANLTYAGAFASYTEAKHGGTNRSGPLPSWSPFNNWTAVSICCLSTGPTS